MPNRIARFAWPLLLAVPLLLALPGAAQETPLKALVLVRDFDDSLRVVSALEQALALKEAGIAVTIIFEGGGVLNLLPPEPGGKAAGAPYRGGFPPGRKIAALRAALQQVPYLVCAYSAARLGVYAGLKAAGRPLCGSAAAPADLAPFIKDGYEVYVY